MSLVINICRQSTRRKYYKHEHWIRSFFLVCSSLAWLCRYRKFKFVIETEMQRDNTLSFILMISKLMWRSIYIDNETLSLSKLTLNSSSLILLLTELHIIYDRNKFPILIVVQLSKWKFSIRAVADTRSLSLSCSPHLIRLNNKTKRTSK